MFIKIDRIRADQCRAIIIDDVFVVSPNNLETCAEREPRPIRGCAAALATSQMGSDSVPASAVLSAGICRGSHVLKPSRVKPSSRNRTGMGIFRAAFQ